MAVEQVASTVGSDQQYRMLLHDLAQELSPENTKGIAFLINWKGQRRQVCSECWHIGGGTNLDVLEAMWQQGVFSETDMEPLIERLKQIGRNDLASKCLTYREELQHCTSEASQEDRSAQDGKTQRSISIPANWQGEDIESDFSPHMDHSLTTPTSTSESPLNSTSEQHRQHFNDSKPDSGIVSSPLSVFSLSFDVDSEATPSHQKHTPLVGAMPLYRRYTIGSLREASYMRDVKNKRRMTFDWDLRRSDFIDPLFNHKNRTFVKKWRYSSGSSSSDLKVHFNVALYPNGINWDQDSFSTLKVLITKVSRAPPSTAFLKFHITGSDCQAGHVICSRQVESSFALKEFVIQEFLSHEVIKESRAKNFEFKITVEVGYHSLEWELIDIDSCH